MVISERHNFNELESLNMEKQTTETAIKVFLNVMLKIKGSF